MALGHPEYCRGLASGHQQRIHQPTCHPEPFATLEGKLREGFRMTSMIGGFGAMRLDLLGYVSADAYEKEEIIAAVC